MCQSQGKVFNSACSDHDCFNKTYENYPWNFGVWFLDTSAVSFSLRLDPIYEWSTNWRFCFTNAYHENWALHLVFSFETLLYRNFTQISVRPSVSVLKALPFVDCVLCFHIIYRLVCGLYINNRLTTNTEAINQSFSCVVLARTVSDNTALLCSFCVSCLTLNASFLL